MEPTINCASCGREFSAARDTCTHCGASRRHAGGPQVWASAGVRRAALLFGALLALLALGLLVWSIADSRRTPTEPTSPVFPVGAAAPRFSPLPAGPAR